MIHPKCCHAATNDLGCVSFMKIAAPKNPLAFSSSSPLNPFKHGDSLAVKIPVVSPLIFRTQEESRRTSDANLSPWPFAAYINVAFPTGQKNVWYMGSLSHISITASMDHQRRTSRFEATSSPGFPHLFGNTWSQLNRSAGRTSEKDQSRMFGATVEVLSFVAEPFYHVSLDLK